MCRRIGNAVPGLALALRGALVAMSAAPAALQAREITDMYGRKVKVPEKITRVYTISPSVMLMLYSIDPGLLVGVPRQLQDEQKPFFKKSFQELPVLGGSSGAGLNLNQELLLKIKPDVMVVWGDDGAYNQKTAAGFEKLGIPVVAVQADSVKEYADTFDFLGKLLDREKRAKELSGYARKTLKEVAAAVAKIPASKRLTVYNTRQGGLTSACKESHHALMVPLAGGVNPVPCVSNEFTGFEKLDMEQVLLINPDAILTVDAAFAQNVYRDSRWAGIRAVKAKRVYLAPAVPINWYDGPPSHMGLLGLQWLTNRLYPQAYPKDIEKEAAAFVKLFFQIDVPREELRKIIGK